MELSGLPVGINTVLFGVAALVVWIAGTYLSRAAEIVSDRTGIGQAFIGALMLGGATSLPEIATTITASQLGNAAMAGNNIIGGILLQTAVLAVVDLICVSGALTFFAPKSALLLSGVLLCLQIALLIAGIAFGDVSTPLAIGILPILLFGTYLASLYFLRRHESNAQWTANQVHDDTAPASETPKPHPASLVNHVYTWFVVCSLAVLAAGWAASLLADTLARQTGVSSGFLGATIVALATSLPEVSTTIAAARQRAYTLAISNIFGSNALMVALFVVADIAYRQGSIINHLAPDAVFLAASGIAATTIYLWGLLERRNATVLGMGVDSMLVTILAIVTLILLYTFQPA
jgi:cation:H+ antiporter